MTQLDTFESALLSELREDVAHRQSATSRRHRRTWIAGAVAASAAAVTGTLLVSGGTPAFAVTSTASGDVVVTVHRLDDPAGLERALADAGVKAEVSYNGASIDRAFRPEDLPDGTRRYDQASCGSIGPRVEGIADGFRITIPAGAVGAGENLRLITSGSTADDADLLVAYGNRNSGCVLLPGSDTAAAWTPAWSASHKAGW